MPKRTTTTDDLSLPWWSERAERIPLNRKQILDAAIALIDRDGLEAFSLRKLAADLGVTTPALYTHVRNREELLVLVFDAVVSQMDLPDPDSTDWAEDLHLIARSWRSTMRTHREIARLSAIGMPLGPSLLRRMDITFGVLLRAGLPTPTPSRSAPRSRSTSWATRSSSTPTTPCANSSAPVSRRRRQRNSGPRCSARCRRTRSRTSPR